MTGVCEQRDLIRTKLFPGMLVLTAAFVAAQIFLPVGDVWFSTGLLLSWAAFCGFNARRCGRLHCYFTAPVLFMGAVAVLLLHFGVVDFPGYWINVFVFGGVALSCLAEMAFGRYFSRGQMPNS